MNRYRIALPLLFAAAGLVVASCASSQPPATGTASSLHDQSLPVWQQFAACARSHGAPDVPDPQVDAAGQATWPGMSSARLQQDEQLVGNACDSILRRLPPQAQPHSASQVSTQELATLRRWSVCMRRHGLPDWPDPNADGSFTLPARISAGGKPLTYPAQQACKDVYNGSFRSAG